MSDNERFLELFREYETLLREDGRDYRQVEEAAEGLMQDRLRLVRQTRNYLTHSNDAGFVEVSGKQLAFLERLVTEQKLSGDILKKHLRTPKTASCTLEDKLDEVLQKMLKLKAYAIPVTDSKGMLAGMVRMPEVTRAYLDAARPKTAKLSTVKKLAASVPCMKPDTPMPAVLLAGRSIPRDAALICCTDTGKMDGKFLGVWFVPQE